MGFRKGEELLCVGGDGVGVAGQGAALFTRLLLLECELRFADPLRYKNILYT